MSEAPEDAPVAEAPRDMPEMLDRLRLHSGVLVDELLKLALKASDSEDARAAQLNTKATSLFAANGLAVTIVFAFGSTLLGRLSLFSASERPLIAGAFLLSLLVGLSSGLFALVALLVRDDHAALDDAHLFDEPMLSSADTETEAEGLKVYRRYIIAHVWSIRRQNKRVLNYKTSYLRRGQIAFFMFMFLVLAIGAMFANAVAWKVGGSP